MFMHGGAFFSGGGSYAKVLGARDAAALGIRVVSVDYRLAPEHRFPAALEDCIAVYGALLESIAPSRLVIGGSSAGGNLAAAAALVLRDRSLPVPAGVVLLSPELDLTEYVASLADRPPRLAGLFFGRAIHRQREYVCSRLPTCGRSQHPRSRS